MAFHQKTPPRAYVLVRLCLFQCKIFSECKIFSGENIFEKGKYFLVFGSILKIMLENNFQCLVTFWKCYFPINFSHFLSFQTNFISQNPPPPTHQHPQKPPKRHHPHHHNNNNQKKKKKSKIKERKQINDEIDLKEEIDRRVADDEIDPEEDETDQAAACFMWHNLDGMISTRSRQRVWLHKVEGSLSLSLSLSLSSKSENGLKWK